MNENARLLQNGTATRTYTGAALQHSSYLLEGVPFENSTGSNGSGIEVVKMFPGSINTE